MQGSDYHLSPFNLTKNLNGQRIIINDATLREGEETPGVTFSIEEKKRLAKRLESLGVPQLEIGITGLEEEAQAVCNLKLICDTEFHVDIGGTEWKSNLQKGIETGATIIDLLVTGSNYFLAGYDPSPTVETYGSRIQESVEEIRRSGRKSSVTSMDGSRTQLQILMRLFTSAVQNHVDRIRLADSVGTLSPPAMRNLIGEVKKVATGTPIGVHCHNDFGQAVTNSLTAVEEGASIVDVTVGGSGARCGIADLVSVVGALTYLYGAETGINLQKLRGVYEDVSKLTGWEVPRNAPLLGTFAFASVMDSDLQAEARVKGALQSVPPGEVGNEARIFLNKYSGPVATKAKLMQLGYDSERINKLSDSTLSEILRVSIQQTRDKGEALTDEEQAKIVSAVLD